LTFKLLGCLAGPARLGFLYSSREDITCIEELQGGVKP
jgi:hypothetical protein